MRSMLVSLILSLFGISMAHAECSHLPYALEHVRLALKDAERTSQEGSAPLLVSNLSNALEHARASEKAERNMNIEKAISDLDMALQLAKEGKASESRMRLEEAMKHLESAGNCPM